jgi:hypothetical protein
MDAVITVGTSCLRNGCKATYQDESSLNEICHYHPGEAEFHEGSKGNRTKFILFQHCLLLFAVLDCGFSALICRLGVLQTKNARIF